MVDCEILLVVDGEGESWRRQRRRREVRCVNAWERRVRARWIRSGVGMCGFKVRMRVMDEGSDAKEKAGVWVWARGWGSVQG